MPSNRLRDLIKSLIGPGAELHHDYFTPMKNRDIIIRFRNNLKTRLIAEEEYDRAYKVVESMLWFAPEEVRLHFDGGILAAKLKMKEEAEEHLQKYIEGIKDARAISEAKAFLYAILNEMD